MKPVYPTQWLPSPYAIDGDKTVPVATNASQGRFAADIGFPPETQKPIAQGGIPPHRWDFNGALYQLSAILFYFQSGGMITWSKDMQYIPPAIVNYNGTYYACVKESGTETDAKKAIQPGTNSAYWKNLFDFLGDKSEAGGFVKTNNTVTLTGDATGSGKFNSAGNASITVDVNEAAQTPKWKTARTVTLTGDVTGSFSIDGTKNVSVDTTCSVADKLRYRRYITLSGAINGTASFDGSSNVVIPTTMDSSAGGSMVPNWPALTVRSNNTQYTANENGYLYTNWGDSSAGNVYINGWQSTWIRNGGSEYVPTIWPICKGDTYRTDGGIRNLFWIPCK